MIIRKVAPNSRAGRVGLREGDVILEVNGRTITDTISWQRAMEQVNKALVFLISREGRTFFVSLRIE
jgi:serine protease Do